LNIAPEWKRVIHDDSSKDIRLREEFSLHDIGVAMEHGSKLRQRYHLGTANGVLSEHPLSFFFHVYVEDKRMGHCLFD
jgi:hypothetical protein